MRVAFLLSVLSLQAFGCVCGGWPSARDAWAGSALALLQELLIARSQPKFPSAHKRFWVTVKEPFNVGLSESISKSYSNRGQMIALLSLKRDRKLCCTCPRRVPGTGWLLGATALDPFRLPLTTYCFCVLCRGRLRPTVCQVRSTSTKILQVWASAGSKRFLDCA